MFCDNTGKYVVVVDDGDNNNKNNNKKCLRKYLYLRGVKQLDGSVYYTVTNLFICTSHLMSLGW
jgi:hypothetical protein